MTWHVHAVVDDVVGSNPVVVHATAESGKSVQPYGLGTVEVPSIGSNTEGVIIRAYLTLLFDAETSPLKVGDIVSASGHFLARDATN